MVFHPLHTSSYICILFLYMRKRMNRRAGCCPIVVQKCSALACLACRSSESPCQSGRPSLGFPRNPCCPSGCSSESSPSACRPSNLHGPAWAAAPSQGPTTARFHAQCLLGLVLTSRFHELLLVGILQVEVVSLVVEVLALDVKGMLVSRWLFVVQFRLHRRI